MEDNISRGLLELKLTTANTALVLVATLATLLKRREHLLKLALNSTTQ